MKFPIVKQGSFSYPKKGNKCPICSKNTINKDKVEQIVLSLGALLKVNENTMALDASLGGFLNIVSHNHNSNKPNINLDIVDMSDMGQADIYFCSIKCLKSFFLTIINELEKQNKKTKNKTCDLN